MNLPPDLQKLADRFNTLADQYKSGVVSEAEATELLAASTTIDGDGAIWGISPLGHFTRADIPGELPQPATPDLYVDPTAPRPPTPAFPSPAPPPFATDDLDTPPQPAHTWSHASPAVGPVLPISEPAATPKSLTGAKGPSQSPAFLGKVADVIAANKAFAIIVTIAALVVGAALIVPAVTRDDPSAQVPTYSDTLPTEALPGEAPAVTSEAPTALDAANLATTLQAGTPEQIQALIAAELDAPTLLRTQALWAGIAQTKTTITPQAAAANGDGTATQQWSLTRDGGTEPVVTIDVTWTTDGTTWKLTAPPTF